MRLKLPALDAQNFSVQELLRDMPEIVLIHLENKLALSEIPGGILTREIIRQAELTLGKIDRARSDLYTERACKDADRQSKPHLKRALDAEYKKLHESRGNRSNAQLGEKIGKPDKYEEPNWEYENDFPTLINRTARIIEEGLGKRGYLKTVHKQK